MGEALRKRYREKPPVGIRCTDRIRARCPPSLPPAISVAAARSLMSHSASFIELVLSDINIKTFIGETPLSGIEHGFFSRIAQIAFAGR
jgi:hypothetical protein